MLTERITRITAKKNMTFYNRYIWTRTLSAILLLNLLEKFCFCDFFEKVQAPFFFIRRFNACAVVRIYVLFGIFFSTISSQKIGALLSIKNHKHRIPQVPTNDRNQACRISTKLTSKCMLKQPQNLDINNITG